MGGRGGCVVHGFGIRVARAVRVGPCGLALPQMVVCLRLL